MEFLLDDEELGVVVRVKRAMERMVKEDGGGGGEGGGGPPGGDGGDGGGVDEDENEDRDEDEKPDDGDGARKDRDSSPKEGNDEKGKGRGTTGGNTLGLAPTLDNSKISTKTAEVSSLFPTAHRSSVLMSPPAYRSLEIEMIRPHPQPLLSISLVRARAWIRRFSSRFRYDSNIVLFPTLWRFRSQGLEFG